MNLAVNKHLAILSTLPIALLNSSAVLANGIETEVGAVINLQHASDNRVDSDGFASFDFAATLPQGNGLWTLYLEANTDIRDEQVSGIIGEANADAGSALDANGNGRLQVSELFYTLAAINGELNLGLLDATGIFDASDVANDEGSQFVGGSFVNNPTIGFPDYTLGVIYTTENEDKRTGYSIAVMSSHGIGDNEHASYSELFNIGDDHKGVFVAGEYNWQLTNSQWRAGVWANTADNEYVNGSNNTSNNYGLYLSTDIDLNGSSLNVRAGLADADVSEASNFIAVTYETELFGNTTGLGLARTGASNELADAKDTVHAEIYSRFDINQHLHITPSIQWIKKSGFDDSETSFDNDITIIGLRAAISF